MNVQFDIKDIRLLNLQYSMMREKSLPGEIEGEGPENEEIEIPVELVCSSNYQNENRILKVTVAALMKEASAGFTLSAEIGGIFHLRDDPVEDVLNRLRHVSCPAILFPYLRETISEVSKRAGLNPLYLPPANFIKVYETAAQKLSAPN